MKNQKGKIFASVISVVLAALILFGAAWGIGRVITGTWDLRKWGAGTHAPDKNPNDGDVGDLRVAAMSLEVEPTDVENGDGGIIYSTNTRSCTITATVFDGSGNAPEILQSVYWELSDENAGLDMSVSGMSATFTVNGGFTKQITATCTSTMNAEVSVSYTFDCYNTNYDFEGAFFGDKDSYTDNYLTPITSNSFRVLGFLTTQDIILNGTILDKVHTISVEFVPTEYLKANFAKYGLEVRENAECGTELYEYDYWHEQGQDFGSDIKYKNDERNYATVVCYFYLDEILSDILTAESKTGDWYNKALSALSETTTNNLQHDFDLDITLRTYADFELNYNYKIDFFSTVSSISTNASSTNIIL